MTFLHIGQGNLLPGGNHLACCVWRTRPGLVRTPEAAAITRVTFFTRYEHLFTR
jgi:hypothetical protein